MDGVLETLLLHLLQSLDLLSTCNNAFSTHFNTLKLPSIRANLIPESQEIHITRTGFPSISMLKIEMSHTVPRSPGFNCVNLSSI